MEAKKKEIEQLKAQIADYKRKVKEEKATTKRLRKEYADVTGQPLPKKKKKTTKSPRKKDHVKKPEEHNKEEVIAVPPRPGTGHIAEPEKPVAVPPRPGSNRSVAPPPKSDKDKAERERKEKEDKERKDKEARDAKPPTKSWQTAEPDKPISVPPRPSAAQATEPEKPVAVPPRPGAHVAEPEKPAVVPPRPGSARATPKQPAAVAALTQETPQPAVEEKKIEERRPVPLAVQTPAPEPDKKDKKEKKEKKDKKGSAEAAATVLFTVKALETYKGKKGELSFTKGAVIKVIEENEDEGTFKGILSGKTGWFPAYYAKAM